MKVLIAHPAAAVRRETRSMLEQLGWEVLEAASSDETLIACRQHSPDVLLLDRGLPEPDRGGSVIEQLRSEPGAAGGIRIVALEAELDVADALDGLRAGIHEYLLKPVHPAEAAVRVRTAGRVKELEERVTQQASDLRGLVHTDVQTGLPNRRFLEQQLAAQINSARRHARPLSLLVLDIDRFKEINDVFGHPVGDVALRHVAEIIRGRLRDEDLVGRWGGDEFVALLPDTEAEGAVTAGKALCRAVADHPLSTGHVDRELAVSVGAATWQGEGAHELFARADAELYEAKRGGRGRVRAASAPTASPAPTGPAPSSKAAAPIRAVVVDDVSEIRELVKIGLQGSSVEVVGEAADGREALALVARAEPDVAVLDMHMPHMDGLQCARELQRRYPRLTTVAYTSTDDPRVVDAMREAGVVRHFAKVQLNDLLAFLTSPKLSDAIGRRSRDGADVHQL